MNVSEDTTVKELLDGAEARGGSLTVKAEETAGDRARDVFILVAVGPAAAYARRLLGDALTLDEAQQQ